MESYEITSGTPKPVTSGLFLWSDRGIYWEKLNAGDSFFVNSVHEAMSVSTCFRAFQKTHPSMSKNLRVVRRKEEGDTGRYQMFFVSDDGSTKNRGSRTKKRISPEHREKIRAAHHARWNKA